MQDKAAAESFDSVARYIVTPDKKSCNAPPDITQVKDLVTIGSGTIFNGVNILVKNGIVYVCDYAAAIPSNDTTPGRIGRFSLSNGAFLGGLDASAFFTLSGGHLFNPRGMVFGPDGLLYVTSASLDADGNFVSITNNSHLCGEYMAEGACA